MKRNISQLNAINYSIRKKANEDAKAILEKEHDLKLLNGLYPNSSYVQKLNYATYVNSKYNKYLKEKATKQ